VELEPPHPAAAQAAANAAPTSSRRFMMSFAQ
jgi:hypothetical protein